MILRVVFRVVLAGLLAAGAAALPQVPGAPVVAGYVVFIAAVATLELVRATDRAEPGGRDSAFERVLRRRPARAGRPEELTRLENEVRLSTVSALDAHRRLRPALREVAAHRLRLRHGVHVDAEPGRARTLLGDEAWALIRPGARPPGDRRARGVAAAELARVLDRIEAL